jgi:hypothetical protein
MEISQRDDKLLSRKIEDEIKKYNVLKTAFGKISESELNLSKGRVSCFDNIAKIEENDNKCN